jgi:hypothetical protein
MENGDLETKQSTQDANGRIDLLNTEREREKVHNNRSENVASIWLLSVTYPTHGPTVVRSFRSAAKEIYLHHQTMHRSFTTLKAKYNNKYHLKGQPHNGILL